MGGRLIERDLSISGVSWSDRTVQGALYQPWEMGPPLKGARASLGKEGNPLAIAKSSHRKRGHGFTCLRATEISIHQYAKRIGAVPMA